jgi:hypothetical protein
MWAVGSKADRKFKDDLKVPADKLLKDAAKLAALWRAQVSKDRQNERMRRSK